jgi:hypothetical protein
MLRQRRRGELLGPEIGTRTWPDRATTRAEFFISIEAFYYFPVPLALRVSWSASTTACAKA